MVKADDMDNCRVIEKETGGSLTSEAPGAITRTLLSPVKITKLGKMNTVLQECNKVKHETAFQNKSKITKLYMVGYQSEPWS